MDERDDCEDDRWYHEPRKEGKVSEHHSHNGAQTGWPPVRAPGAGDAAGRSGGLQPLVPPGCAGRLESGPLRTPLVHRV